MTERTPRPAARILLFDPQGRVLLFRFTPDNAPPLWATPGGALDTGETFEEAARRELREECGLDVDCGPQIAQRDAEFVTFAGVPVFADERYFRVHAGNANICTEGHSQQERQLMRDFRWFWPNEIAAWPETIFPENLCEMISELEQTA